MLAMTAAMDTASVACMAGSYIPLRGAYVILAG